MLNAGIVVLVVAAIGLKIFWRDIQLWRLDRLARKALEHAEEHKRRVEELKRLLRGD